jgi:hypothetical protein
LTWFDIPTHEQLNHNSHVHILSRGPQRRRSQFSMALSPASGCELFISLV